MPPSLTTKEMRLALAGAIIVQLTIALMARRFLGPSDSIDPTSLMIAYLILPSLAAILWIWFSAVWSEADGWGRVGFAWIDRRWCLRAAVMGLASVPALMLITAITAPLIGPSSGPALPMPMEQAWDHPGYLLSLTLGIVVLAPLMEEMVFRGLLYGWLRRHMGLWQAAAIAALGHAVLHLDLGGLPGLFVLFVFLGWVYEYAQNLWVPVIIHGVHNLLVLQLS